MDLRVVGNLGEQSPAPRFYTITAAGRRQLQVETRNWERITGVMTRLLRLVQEP